ncbi:MAG: rRNA maturation RNase YbeY [Cytophagales bacterium]|nr:MAG: rRNA maturation RNase YbeY [Cytophagales bacterium]
MKIHFFSENTPFELPKTEAKNIKKWIETIIKQEKYTLINLNYIFCDDQYLHQINWQYLEHDTYTDIITFDNAEEPQTIEGDIFISIERVQENAQQFNQPFQEELYRVLAHGILHLIGYQDKTQEQSQLMRQKENEALRLFKNITLT